ncbi:MAG: hypothetical protein GY720_01900 [bacterium]|nr:hypothetical protein [bacterium]
MILTSTARKAGRAVRACTFIGVLGLVIAGCASTSETTTMATVPGASITSVVPVETTAPTTTVAMTTTTTTTTAVTASYAVASHGAGAVAALAGSNGMLGSGCVPGEGLLPDGIWFGWVEKGATGISFDLACLEEASVPIATNSNPKLRQVAIADDLTIRHRDGSTETYAGWAPSSDPVWLYINNGIASEVAYSTIDIFIDTGGNTDWVEASVSLPVGGGCCGEMYSGPASPDEPLPASGLPADGVYGVELTIDEPNNELVLEIRKFIACSERPDLCNPDYFEGDIALNHEESITRRVALDENLTVRLMGIHVDPSIDPDAVNAIEGSGEAFARLLADNAAAFETWVAPRLAAGEDYQVTYETLAALGADDPKFPYTVSLCCDADWSPLVYRGPMGVELVEWLFEPYGFIGPVQMEMVDGLPILIIDGGRIAG